MAATMIMVIASICFVSCEREVDSELTIADTDLAEDRGPAESIVFGPNSRPYGKSYVDWTILWMQQFMAFNCDQNPFTNPDNVLFHQNGPVYFLAGLAKPNNAVKVRVPQGKAILFPLVNYLNDYPCPDKNFEPAPGQSLEKFLRAGALNALADVQGLSVEVDGTPINHLQTYQFTSRLFTFTGHPELANCFDPCITGQAQKAVTSGYYVMLKPMKKGLHEVRYRSQIPTINFVQDGTYYIEVI